MNLLNLQSLPLETWADPEVNSTNIAILSIILLILLSLPPQALSLRRNLGLMMKMTILQDQKLLLRIMFFSKRWNWFCMQRVFQEVLSKSQKKKKALQSSRTEPYLTRGRKVVIPRWKFGIYEVLAILDLNWNFLTFAEFISRIFFVFLNQWWLFLLFPFWLSLNLTLVAVNDRGSSLPNIWVLCNNSLDPTVICNSTQPVSIKIGIDNVTCCLSFVYASTNPYTRRQLWQNLSALSLNGGPWMVIGDFNAVIGAHEKKGGCPPLQLACREFKQMSDSCNLIHLNTTGSPFTWSNGWRSRGHIELRLDRSLCNSEWLDNWSHTNCLTLPRLVSDHNPLLNIANKAVLAGPRPFRFHSMWLQHGSFQEVVFSCWNNTMVTGCPMFVVLAKLRALKECLKHWNKNVFGDIHSKVEKARSLLAQV